MFTAQNYIQIAHIQSLFCVNLHKQKDHHKKCAGPKPIIFIKF